MRPEHIANEQHIWFGKKRICAMLLVDEERSQKLLLRLKHAASFINPEASRAIKVVYTSVVYRGDLLTLRLVPQQQLLADSVVKPGVALPG